MGETKRIRKGDRVRDTKWSGKYTGTVVRTKTSANKRWVFIQWDGIAIEDQLLDYEVEALGTRVEGEIAPVFLTVHLGIEGKGS